MAPPRQRTAALLDDSRSEASSGMREPKPAGNKSKRAVNGTSAGASGRGETKAAAAAAAAAAATNVTSAPSNEADEQAEDHAKIPWTDLPLDILHSYRHVYGLSTPSAFSRDYSRLLLSRGIGLRSPTALAARRAQHHSRLDRHAGEPNGTGSGKGAPATSSAAVAAAAARSTAKKMAAAAATSDGKATPTTNGLGSSGNLTPLPNPSLSGWGSILDARMQAQTQTQLDRIIGPGRVSKDQLALAVRKHFNGVALAEQEAIARFLYKVREEGRGRQFRLRFQP